MAVTIAPGTIAFCSSLTVPLIPDVVTCALATIPEAINAPVNINAYLFFIMYII
jgi:hypothetical protein